MGKGVRKYDGGGFSNHIITLAESFSSDKELKLKLQLVIDKVA